MTPPHKGEFSDLLQARPAGVSIPVGASPFTYTAQRAGSVIITGGTVTTIELGRAGVFVPIGLLSGVVPLARGDQVRVTYLLAPTMTLW